MYTIILPIFSEEILIFLNRQNRQIAAITIVGVTFVSRKLPGRAIPTLLVRNTITYFKTLVPRVAKRKPAAHVF